MLFEPATPHHKYGKNQTVFRKFFSRHCSSLWIQIQGAFFQNVPICFVNSFPIFFFLSISEKNVLSGFCQENNWGENIYFLVSISNRKVPLKNNTQLSSILHCFTYVHSPNQDQAQSLRHTFLSSVKEPEPYFFLLIY